MLYRLIISDASAVQKWPMLGGAHSESEAALHRKTRVHSQCRSMQPRPDRSASSHIKHQILRPEPHAAVHENLILNFLAGAHTPTKKNDSGERAKCSDRMTHITTTAAHRDSHNKIID